MNITGDAYIMLTSSSKVCLLSSTQFISDDGIFEVEKVGGCQSGGSEGKRSSGGEAVARFAVLLGEEGERISSVSPRFIYV